MCAGHVLTYEKFERSRLAVQGIREALVDVMLLADCPVLIGTYYSSYSETAKMMGWPFYIQVKPPSVSFGAQISKAFGKEAENHSKCN